jgi:type I restriction enzyme R subunit
MTQHSKFSEAAADLYESNKAIMKLVSDGFLLKREDRSQKDLYIQLIDYSELVAFREPNPAKNRARWRNSLQPNNNCQAAHFPLNFFTKRPFNL